jgi:catechol 2,3-dioxygenase-like lactoylglutathione lyase family enzyme
VLEDRQGTSTRAWHADNRGSIDVMTEWFARPVLHVSNVEASLRFYVDRLGFTVPWRVEDKDGRAHIAEVDRQGCALILSDERPENVGTGLMFVSLVVGDLDGNQLFVPYPNEPQTKPEGLVILDAER